MRIIRPALLLASMALLLAGCAVATPAKTPTPIGPTPNAHYSTVVALKKAFEQAGGYCPDWVQNDNVTSAAQSGDCTEHTTLMIFTSTDDRDQVVANNKSFASYGEGIPINLLVGENWIINTPNPDQFAEQLGGTVVTK